jgi:hypothetical protein
MNNETKIWIIIIIFIIATLRTILDVVDEIYFPIHKVSQETDFHTTLDNIKKILDIPFLIFSVYLLFFIKFNLKIYAFIFMVLLNLFSDYFIEVSNNPLGLDENVIYLIDRYKSLTLDIITTIIGIYVLRSVFNVSK